MEPMSYLGEYDVIVVGGGHAGCEAAVAAANLGSSVLLITMNMATIGQMSCNPAMGGVGKGQIVREIDALGGYSGIVSDRSMIQFRMLNRSKGPAMWSPRSQNDRTLFAIEWRKMLEQTNGLDMWQDSVTELIIENDRVAGVATALGERINSKTVILTNGTFLGGLIHIGEKNFGGGRVGERASYGITDQLNSLGFKSGRMKTGTPPRVDGRSLDYSKMEEQPGDPEPGKFSYSSSTSALMSQRSCHITYTNNDVHDTLRVGFEHSPMFAGRIEGVGPRYCPSIEDKIERFADRDRHQIFVEPEGWDTVEVYVNGFSTSLPEAIQFKALRLIPGFENCKPFRPGYAIEYDYFPPTQISNDLQTKNIKGLFLAGQINGTTGYEEAACQGLMAGINAHKHATGVASFVLSRSEAYIGVLIDDLITKGTEEPYRMFTSRAEYRLLLRQDNADLRLTPKAHELGLVSDKRMARVEQKASGSTSLINSLRTTSISPDEINPILTQAGSAPTKQKVKLDRILSRPQVNMNDLEPFVSEEISKIEGALQKEVVDQVEISIKYGGYINKERELAERLSDVDHIPLKDDLDYSKLGALSNEAREKLLEVRPTNLGQAGRISGVSPADISYLMVYLGR